MAKYVHSNGILNMAAQEQTKTNLHKYTRLVEGQIHQEYTASMMLDIPRTTTSLGDRAFAVAGLRVWNSLPPAIRDPSLSPSIFGKLLKTYLFV